MKEVMHTYMKSYVYSTLHIAKGGCRVKEERKESQTKQTTHISKHKMNRTLRCPALRTGTVG